MDISIRHILVPVDLTEASGRIIDFARSVARGVNAEMHLVHVLEEPFTSAGPYEFHLPDTPERRERLYTRARARLTTIADRIRCKGIQATVEVRSGTAADEIVKAAIDYGTDLIVMGTHGRSGLHHLLHGGVADRVTRRAPCPVLAIRDHGGAMTASAA